MRQLNLENLMRFRLHIGKMMQCAEYIVKVLERRTELHSHLVTFLLHLVSFKIGLTFRFVVG